MKRVIIFSMVVAALVMAFSGLALAGTAPQDIYNDYADNGQLDGTYTDAQLQAYLDDATVHQYGDESTTDELDTLATTMLTDESRSEFPFTGMEMGLMVIGALVLVGAGFVLRKASR
jgi:hypothetical protein